MRPFRTFRTLLVFSTVTLLLAPGSGAGELEPPGPPAPTMKSLDEVPPSWSQRLDSTDGAPDGCDSSRFRCVMGADAVLDLETGLVWERAPATTLGDWAFVLDLCSTAFTGARFGWRLPSLEELHSLADPFQPPPRLPPGHPFQGIQSHPYWTSTTDWLDPASAAYVNFLDGFRSFDPKSEDHGRWCVRGGSPNRFSSQP